MFAEEEKVNNYMETHVMVYNQGEYISVEPICKNNWGGRYDIFGMVKTITIGDVPESLRVHLPYPGDWHDVSFFPEEGED